MTETEPAETRPATASGIFPNMPFDAYRAIPAVNQSLLKNFARSAQHVKHRLDHDDGPPSAALEFGTAVHTAVLEPSDFDRSYVVAPVADKRTKKWKEFVAGTEETGKKILSASDASTIESMIAGIDDHTEANRLLEGVGINEVSLVWDDGEDGETKCKARADRIRNIDEVACVIDLKTTTSVAPQDFARDAARYGYHLQAAWYLRALDRVIPKFTAGWQGARRFLIIAVEKTAPFACAVYEFDEEAIEAGANRIDSYLRRWEHCCRFDHWPPPAGEGIERLHLPAWATVDDGGPDD